MEYPRAKLVRACLDFFGSDERRIEHSLRVLRHAERIAEHRADCDPEIVIAAALLHDIGGMMAEQQEGRDTAEAQERLGPPLAKSILNSIGFPPEKTHVVANIVGNHHSPSRHDYPELEVLKAADLIVNTNEPL
jgi:putative nucleotidyltransferase with HDIG domain